MKKNWMRWLSALMCLALVWGGVGLSEEAAGAPEAIVEEVIEAEVDTDDAEAEWSTVAEEIGELSEVPDAEVDGDEIAAPLMDAPAVDLAENDLVDMPAEAGDSDGEPDDENDEPVIDPADEPLPEPVEILLAPAAVTLGAGEKQTLKLTTQAADVTFSSDEEAVATVSDTGVITAVGVGEAMIVAAEPNGGSASCLVTVLSAPTGISLSAARATRGVGETLTLKATLPGGSASRLTWKTSARGVARVNAKGVVTPKKVGKVTISVTTFNGKKASCVVTVKKVPTAVKLSAARLTLCEGDVKTLKATLSAGSASVLTWSSSNEAVATVNKKGRVTAVGAGTAKITVKTFNGKCATCAVTVKPLPDEIRLSKSAITLYKGKKVTLKPAVYGAGVKTVARLTYATNKQAVAAVSAKGVVTAKKAGSATITITTHNGIQKKVSVTVKNLPVITVSGTSVTLKKGATVKLNPVVKQDGKRISATVKCKSSNTSVATVSSAGVVTGKNAGTATIIISSANAKSVTVRVTVKNPPKPASSGTVYVTPSGAKYHRATCPTLSRSRNKYSMSVSEARAQGYEPCKVCKP